MTCGRSKFRHPALPKNALGYSVGYYEGRLCTLGAVLGYGIMGLYEE